MSKSQSKQLLRRLVKSAQLMVQGGLSETIRPCDNRNCICHRDPAQRHGPHLYLTYRSEGIQQLRIGQGHHQHRRWQNETRSRHDEPRGSSSNLPQIGRRRRTQRSSIVATCAAGPP